MWFSGMGKFMKPGKVVMVLAGRYAGRKAVIVKVRHQGLVVLSSLHFPLACLLPYYFVEVSVTKSCWSWKYLLAQGWTLHCHVYGWLIQSPWSLFSCLIRISTTALLTALTAMPWSQGSTATPAKSLPPWARRRWPRGPRSRLSLRCSTTTTWCQPGTQGLEETQSGGIVNSACRLGVEIDQASLIIAVLDSESDGVKVLRRKVGFFWDLLRRRSR